MAVMTSAKYSLVYERQINEKVKEGYIKYQPEFKEFAKVMAAPAGREYQSFITSGIGMPRELPEGSGVEFDDFAEGNRQYIYYTTYGLGFQVTWQMMQDLIFKDAVSEMSTSLGEMHAYRKDLDFFRMFAEADGTSYRKAPDGKAVCANNHVTIKSGHTINNVASASLADTALQAAFEYVWGGQAGNMPMAENGLPLRLQFDTLLVGPKNAFKAMQLLNQSYGVSSGLSPFTAGSNYPASSDTDNVFNPKNGYVPTYKVKVGLAFGQLLAARGGNYAGSWMLLDTKNLKAVVLNKQEFTQKSWEDDRTGNLLTKGFMRYGMGWLDYKAVYGSFTA